MHENISEYERYSILKKEVILCKARNFINIFLNPIKETYRGSLTMDEVLLKLDISSVDYRWELSTSNDKDYKIHLKRDTDSCFISN